MRFEKIYIELSDICGLNCGFCPSVKGVRGAMSVALACTWNEPSVRNGGQTSNHLHHPS